MGFETPEDAERWAENMEFRADQRREERLLTNAELKEAAWREVMELPAYKDIPDRVHGVMRSVFDYAWMRALKAAR